VIDRTERLFIYAMPSAGISTSGLEHDLSPAVDRINPLAMPMSMFQPAFTWPPARNRVESTAAREPHCPLVGSAPSLTAPAATVQCTSPPRVVSGGRAQRNRRALRPLPKAGRARRRHSVRRHRCVPGRGGRASRFPNQPSRRRAG
jgi:hypothetical protein